MKNDLKTAKEFLIKTNFEIWADDLANVVGKTMVDYHNQLINQTWIEILHKEDLPTKEDSYFVFSNSKFPRVDIFTGRLSNTWNNELNKCYFTHYIKINKPNPPINKLNNDI